MDVHTVPKKKSRFDSNYLFRCPYSRKVVKTIITDIKRHKRIKRLRSM